jgi:hypothetical protein
MVPGIGGMGGGFFYAVASGMHPMRSKRHGMRVRIGDRVHWYRADVGHGTGYVTKIISDDGRGSKRYRVRSNGGTYVLLPSDLRADK